MLLLTIPYWANHVLSHESETTFFSWYIILLLHAMIWCLKIGLKTMSYELVTCVLIWYFMQKNVLLLPEFGKRVIFYPKPKWIWMCWRSSDGEVAFFKTVIWKRTQQSSLLPPQLQKYMAQSTRKKGTNTSLHPRFRASTLLILK